MLTIPETFENADVFVTGGTGFLGKTLIEKLLRSCPKVGIIYVLVRGKRGKTAEQRIDEIISCALFDKIKAKCPDVMKKIKPIVGDLAELRLGLSAEDEDLITSTVSFIYNMAATVRFDEALHDAIIINVRSAREVSNLSLRCKKLKLLTHVSTCYCNVDNSVMEEKLYPPPIDWKDAIRLSEQGEIHSNALTLKCTDGWPNTYTFSKRLAEAVVVDTCSGKVPLVILRPSIVIFVLDEPQPGWNDNMNGPFSLTVAVLKGIVSVLYGDRDTVLNMVFVDNVVKGILMATWEKLNSEDLMEIKFYNACSDVNLSLERMRLSFNVINEKLPHNGRLWHNENFNYTKCWYYYYATWIMTHISFAIVLDSILKLTGNKPRVLKVTRRIYIAMQMLEFFMTHKFHIKNENYLQLDNKILEEDREDFKYIKKNDTRQEDLNNAVLLATEGIKKFLLNEPVPPLPETYKNTYRLYILRVVLMILTTCFWMYILVWKYNVPGKVFGKVYNYIEGI